MLTNRANITSILFCVLTALILTVCGNQSNSKAGTIDEKNINTSFNETALFLAGREIPENSVLSKITKSKFYESYKRQIDALWKSRQETNLNLIEGWREKNLSEKYTSTVYYPFAGPDIMNALAFFPNGKEYIMFALETPGNIPEPQKMTEEKIRAGIAGLDRAVNTILKMNFFKTKEMQTQVGSTPFDGATGIMMFFLGRMSYEVLDAKKIWLDDKSEISYTPLKDSAMSIPGSEITFRKSKNSPVQRIIYFQTDVSDFSIRNHKNFIAYLESKKECTTIIKAASYLMHRDNEFSVIRGITLSMSEYLLQEDSGIPYRFFNDKDWKLSFYGVYFKPINLFASRFQADFKKAMDKNSSGPLPFIYGYNFVEQKYNLMFAERVKDKRN